MSLRCCVVKEVENFQKSLLDPARDLNQTLQSAPISTAVTNSYLASRPNTATLPFIVPTKTLPLTIMGVPKWLADPN